MLTNSVMILLHEVLEVALVFGVLLAISRLLRQKADWGWRALMIGLIGAAVYGSNLDLVTNTFSGTGQELVNAFLQAIEFLALLYCLFVVARRNTQRSFSDSLLTIFMITGAASAITLEGSEILVYAIGFVKNGNAVATASFGSLIGAMVALSIGVLFYFVLVLQPESRSRLAILIVTVAVGAGTLVQASRELIQAGILRSEESLWDTSEYLEEDSVVGQFLYALMGYEATPTAIEVRVYIASLMLMIIVATIASRKGANAASI